MPLPPLPIPGVTLPNWGDQLLDGLEARYDKGTIAKVANGTGTGYGFTTVATLIPGMVLSVPPSDHDVWIEWQAYIGLLAGTTADSRGPLYTLLYDISNGGVVAVDSDVTHKSLGINYVSANLDKHHGNYNAGPSATPRVYALWAQVVKEAGTTLNGLVVNAAVGPTTMTAVAK